SAGRSERAFAPARSLLPAEELTRPHEGADACVCRKPKPALFFELAGTYGVDLAASTHVGDSVKDRDAAAAAGVGTFVWPRQFFGWQE
ncbi:MAG TPA: HAD hydrolase-like protein, partial [Planctomycetota bacterium]|nr:HAD hydrolase-like protein [Planctomycetota bacterium]